MPDGCVRESRDVDWVSCRFLAGFAVGGLLFWVLVGYLAMAVCIWALLIVSWSCWVNVLGHRWVVMFAFGGSCSVFGDMCGGFWV